MVPAEGRVVLAEGPVVLAGGPAEVLDRKRVRASLTTEENAARQTDLDAIEKDWGTLPLPRYVTIFANQSTKLWQKPSLDDCGHHSYSHCLSAV